MAHAWTTAALVKGLTTRRELATLLIDGISTPKGIAYGSHVRANVNKRFRSTRVVAAISLDSRTSDGLQLADMVASAIAYERHACSTKGRDYFASNKTPKAELARYLARSFDLSNFDDAKSARVKIRTAMPKS